MEGEATELTESFFAWATGVLGVMMETGALGMVCCGVRVATDGREAAGLGVEAARDARDARGVAREVVAVCSALGREAIEGRFAAPAAAAVDGAMVDRLSDGVALPAAPAVPAPARVLRTAGFLFSSAASPSASACAALVPSVVRLAAVPSGARVGGLFRLEPVPARREVELAGGLDALLGGRVVLFVDAAADADAAAAGGRRTPTEAAAGRRGGTGSFFAAAAGACEAILRRTTDEGEDGGGSALLAVLAVLEVLAAALLRAASLAEVLDPSAAMLRPLAVRGAPPCGNYMGRRRSSSSRGEDSRIARHALSIGACSVCWSTLDGAGAFVECCFPVWLQGPRARHDTQRHTTSPQPPRNASAASV